MTWWIAFTIAVLGWYFTATQNAKNSARTLINQEIKEARTKLHELIVSCSSEGCELPLKPMNEEFVKMQTYIVSIQELDRLYASYHLPYFKHIRIVSVPLATLTKLSEHENLSGIKKFIRHWVLPQSHGAGVNRYMDFDLSDHASSIRISLTDDMKGMTEEQRLAMLNLQYKELCLAYQFVS
ncbi:hypothetical protein [Vibrio diazotrophicus]|uniref:Uncharacterized protein n=1 Tax=Vibrio diazotrophicus TaxID=685 RepID=A0ABX4W5V9_VIBDI|nr:hypothetical protein [Vibrio diazotrophicus]PNH98458.1 hypothetical protein C1O25_18650 [Vibrio diazotrophicus]